MRNSLVGPFRLFTSFLLVSMALLSGCAAVKFAYEEGDTFTLLWSSRYISLDKEQTAFARPRLEAWFQWHRTTQLPDYAQLAAQLQKQVDAPVTAPEMEAVEKEVRERYHRMIDRALPDLAELALRLREDQLPQLQKKFDANDTAYRSDFVDASPERRKKDFYTKELERFEYWYGSLSGQQKAALRRASDALPIDPTLWLSERRAREQELVVILYEIAQKKPAPATVIEMLGKYAARLETSPDPTHRRYIEALDQANRELYMNMANLMTAEQRQHAVEKLGDWIGDLETLSRGA